MPRMVAIGAVLGFGIAVLLLTIFGGNAPPQSPPAQTAPAAPQLPMPVRRDLVHPLNRAILPPALPPPVVTAVIDGGR